jgi:hypothetical protein
MSLSKDRFGFRLNLWLAVFVLIGAVFLSFYKGKTEIAGHSEALEILDTVSGKVYGSWPVGDGAEFAIEFIHSVNQSPVRETFKIEGKQIRPESVRFYSFGAGMQTDLEAGQTMTQDGDAMIISGFNHTFAVLNYIVGTVSDHLLFVNGETVSLRELCGRNAHIRIRIK